MLKILVLISSIGSKKLFKIFPHILSTSFALRMRTEYVLYRQRKLLKAFFRNKKNLSVGRTRRWFYESASSIAHYGIFLIFIFIKNLLAASIFAYTLPLPPFAWPLFWTAVLPGWFESWYLLLNVPRSL